MCWPAPEGVIEIEERRRRYPNEPRRKRLHFVKDHSSRRSDEWDLIHPRPRSRPEMPEMYEQHHQQPHHQLEVEDPRWAAHLQQLPPPHMQHQIPPPPPQQQMGWYPPQQQLPYNHPNEVIRVEEYRPEHDPHDNPHNRPPVVIERQPRVARMPSHVRARSRSRHRGHSRAGSSLFSDESSYGGSHGRGRPRRPEVWRENDSWIEPRRESLRRVTTTTRRLN
ncbi:MAG: hypothetical protein HETSPECPRED_003755 [Heterodermia speciosa]|uniref:Uncharacterized protein n=1 Tax=Heterodermia speciosa TaxID=116794 RepID=A0A8H3F352_9LECA|nr:MAG: hypothetical protein HETSPECPRED_003755 [Heterodermia speciosa]